MPLYKLNCENTDLNTGVLERVKSQEIDFEKSFESWLENSPDVLLGDEGTILWIGRQVKADIGDTGRSPDLLGIDGSGNLIIVELKKGKSPRDVVAQILEYASWSSTLDYEQLNGMAAHYFQQQNRDFTDLNQAHRDVFSPDSDEDTEVEFNENQRLFIVAEELAPTVRQVCGYLRSKFQMSIFCVEYEVFKTEQGELLISTETIGGFGDVGISKQKQTSVSRWNYPIKVKTAIHEAVKEITGNEMSSVFSPSDVYKELVKKYQDVNRSTVGCQIIQDCVNHPSRKHYPGGQQDFYFRIEKGKFRLYNPNSDGKWNSKGEPLKS